LREKISINGLKDISALTLSSRDERDDSVLMERIKNTGWQRAQEEKFPNARNFR